MISSSGYHKTKQYIPTTTSNYILTTIPSKLTALGASVGCSGLPWWLSGKEINYECRRHSLIPGLGRSPAGGNGNSLQYSCLGNRMDRGVWWATVHGVPKVTMTQQLSNNKGCPTVHQLSQYTSREFFPEYST